MNTALLASRRQAFLRVYQHEISRRKQISAEKPKAYAKIFTANNKGLKSCCEPHQHCWVPMTHLWIHDGASAKGYTISGFKRRGFKEATPFKDGEWLIVPQMCWYCVKSREVINQTAPWKDKYRTVAAQIIKDNKGKNRGRAGSDIMMHDLDDLFETLVTL